MDSHCIWPDCPYCPACPYGQVVYPEWVETYDDIPYAGLDWICNYDKPLE